MKRIFPIDKHPKFQLLLAMKNNLDFKICLLISILTLIFMGSFLRYWQYTAKCMQLNLIKQQKIVASKIQASNSNSVPSNLNQNLFPAQNDQTTIFNFPIIQELRIPSSEQKVTAVINTCCSRYDLLEQTLSSFFRYNTFLSGLVQVIVVNDGPQIPQITPVKMKYQNITWIFTPETVGQIQAIDIAYSQVKTPFVFHAQDDWLFLRPKFIEVSFEYFQRIPKLLQTWIKVTNQTVNQSTRVVGSSAFGFSFNPGLKKMQHQNMLKNGYKWISKDISHKKGAGKAQGLIIRYYKKKGFCVAQTQLNYVRHIGENRSLPKANF